MSAAGTIVKVTMQGEGFEHPVTTLWIVATPDAAAAVREVRRHITPEWEADADGSAAPGEVERIGLRSGRAAPYPLPVQQDRRLHVMAVERARAIGGQVLAGVIGAMVTAIVGYIVGVPALIASAATKAVAQVVVDRLEFEIQPETAATTGNSQNIRCRDGYVLVMPLCQWVPAGNQHSEGFFADVKLKNRDGNRVGTCTWTVRMGNNAGSVGTQALCLRIK